MAFNKYQVIKNALSYELANFIFNYFMLKRDSAKFMYDNNIIHDNGMFGTWTDAQIPNTYSHYADPVMETLLMKVLPKMQQETGLQLIPTYSYARLYKKVSEFSDHFPIGQLSKDHRALCSNQQPHSLHLFCSSSYHSQDLQISNLSLYIESDT